MFGFKSRKQKLAGMSFIECHEYQFEAGRRYLIINVKGRDYKKWTSIKTVMEDLHIASHFKGKEIDYMADGTDQAEETLSLFCEHVVDSERKIEDSKAYGGNLKEFYTIQNL